MNMSVEKETQNVFEDVAVQETQVQSTTLGQLGQAIRRSILFFVFATIALIVAFVLIINRQQQFSLVSQLRSHADDLEIQVLHMLENEKNFKVDSNETYVLSYEKNYKEAKEIIASIQKDASILTENKAALNRIDGSLVVYSKIFDQAVNAYRKRGFSDETGSRQQARQSALRVISAVSKLGLPELDNAVLKASGEAKNFIILERPQFVDTYNREVNDLRAGVEQAVEIDSDARKAVLMDIDTYQATMNEYFKLTVQANKAFDDSSVAVHATLYPLPALREELKKIQDGVSKQLLYILIAIAIILIVIFSLVVYQLRRAQTGANETLEETKEAQRRAEAENDRLNDSVINILEAVSALSQRDLTVKAPVTEDIIGTVSDSINSLTDETAKVLTGVTGIAGRVANVSTAVRLQAGKVSETSAQERQSVQAMIESLFEATQTMNQVAALAEQSNESAGQATQITDEALESVTDTVSDMENIRETISETEKRIKRLGDRSQEISGIVNLINTISERTHALALNASMQAAVAGEAGRGFAVVAEEVQRLAESSRNATEQIATLVSNIQLETNETINTVNQTITQVVEGSEQAQKAGEQMRQTKEITAQLVDRVREIARASDQQKTMSAQLLESVQQIGDSTEQTAQQIEEQNEGTQALQEAATELVNSVNVFKLPKLDS